MKKYKFLDKVEFPADIRKLKKTVNIKNFTPLNKGLKNLINWYKSFYKIK